MAFHSYNFILYFLPVFVIGFFLVGAVCGRLCPGRRLFAQQLWCIAASAFYYVLNETDLWWVVVLLMAVNYGIVLLMRSSFAVSGHKASPAEGAPDPADSQDAALKKAHRGKDGILLRKECSWRISRGQLLAAGIVLNVAVLFVFKYLQTFLAILDRFLGTTLGETPISSPAGLSFLTFQQIIYLVAAWRKETDRDSLTDYLTYLTWFPKAISGPITPRETLVGPFHPASGGNADEQSERTAGRILSGIVLFCYGLGKKVLLADVLALAVDWGIDNIDLLTAADAVVVMLAYTFQIYYDFSGYTDMARGISRMVGLELPLNFDSPYRAVSIRDFWKRWHLSLTGFLTRYIYIPLGGSRKGTGRTYVNTMIVFLVSGMWHGSAPSFVLWGLIHGVLSVFDRQFARLEEKVPKLLRWLGTFLCVNLLWLLFRTHSISKFLRIVRTMFTGFGSGISSGMLEAITEMSLIPGLSGMTVLAGYLLVSFVICLIPWNTNRIAPEGDTVRLPQMAWAIVLLVLSLFNLSSVGTFLYYNF